MSILQIRDWLSELEVGDICMYQNSPIGLYYVVSLTNAHYGGMYLTLKYRGLGTEGDHTGTPFEYEKINFNRDFSIYLKKSEVDADKTKVKLAMANLNGMMNEVHELLVKVEV